MWMLESHDHTSWWKYGEDHGHDVPGYAWRWVFKVGNRWKFWSLEAIPQPRGDDLDRIRDRTIFEHIFPVLKNVSHPRHPYDHGKLTQIKKYVKIESTFQVADKSIFSRWWLDPKISGALRCPIQVPPNHLFFLGYAGIFHRKQPPDPSILRWPSSETSSGCCQSMGKMNSASCAWATGASRCKVCGLAAVCINIVSYISINYRLQWLHYVYLQYA